MRDPLCSCWSVANGRAGCSEIPQASSRAVDSRVGPDLQDVVREAGEGQSLAHTDGKAMSYDSSPQDSCLHLCLSHSWDAVFLLCLQMKQVLQKRNDLSKAM